MGLRYQITISDQAQVILESMLSAGIYGASIPEIMKRLIDRSLVELIEPQTRKPKP
jgi:hypothetical protein